MSPHPLRTLIETCDAAISRRDFDALMTPKLGHPPF